MEKNEIKLIVAEEALKEARAAHEEAVKELLIAKKRGTYSDEHHRQEVEKRHELAAAERRYTAAKEAMQPVISDEEANKLGDYFAGRPSGWETEAEGLSEVDDALVNAIVDGLDV